MDTGNPRTQINMSSFLPQDCSSCDSLLTLDQHLLRHQIVHQNVILIIHQLNNSIDEICHQCDLWQFSSGVVNDTPNTDNGSESHKIPRDIKITAEIKIATEIKITTAKTFTYAQARIFNVLRNHVLAAMTDLELWTFCCIVSVFVSLVSYGIILVKDQMIIQVRWVGVSWVSCLLRDHTCRR